MQNVTVEGMVKERNIQIARMGMSVFSVSYADPKQFHELIITKRRISLQAISAQSGLAMAFDGRLLMTAGA